MKTLKHILLDVLSLGFYLLLVCGVDILFNRTTAWTILYAVAGLLFDYRPRLALGGLGLAFFVARGIFGVGIPVRTYLAAQLLLCIACAGARCLVNRRTANEVHVGTTFGIYLRPTLLLMAVGLATICILIRVRIAMPLGWMALVLVVWPSLPKAPSKPPIDLRRVAFGSVATAISLLATLALVELGTRLFLEVPRYQSETTGPHPISITTLVPNTSEQWTTPVTPGVSKSYSIDISPQGLRDRFFELKRPNEYRIAMVGDSFTWGAVLEENETIPKVLERRLAERFPECEISVVNAGVGAYAPWQERIFLGERVFPLEPDAVVLQLYPENDVPDSLIPYGEYLQAYLEEWRAHLRLLALRGRWPMQFDRWLRIHSYAYRRLIAAMGERWAVSTWIMKTRVAPAIPALPPNAPRPCSIEPALRDPYPLLEKAWRKYEEDIAGIVEDCRSRNIEVLVYAIPARSTADKTLWTSLALTSDMEFEQYEYALEMHRTKRFVQGFGVDYVDLLDDFTEANDPQAFYYVFDGHLSPAGVAVVVENLLELIGEKWPVCNHEEPSTPRR